MGKMGNRVNRIGSDRVGLRQTILILNFGFIDLNASIHLKIYRATTSFSSTQAHNFSGLSFNAQAIAPPKIKPQSSTLVERTNEQTERKR